MSDPVEEVEEAFLTEVILELRSGRETRAHQAEEQHVQRPFGRGPHAGQDS